jgi:Tfp pilus assembly protein PilE
MSRNNCSGATLIELIVAIVVTGIITVIAFGFFTNIVKGFWKNNRASEAVKEMITAKAIIQSKVRNVGTIISWRKDGIDYLSSDAQACPADSTRTMVFKDSVVSDNNLVMVKGVAEFSFAVNSFGNDKPGLNSALLTWEAKMGDQGWIGGAKEVKIYRSAP